MRIAKTPLHYFLQYVKRMPAKVNRLGKFARKTRRRRVANVTKVRYQRPSAANQRRQIMSNAKKLAWVSKIVKASRLWCDWQFSSSFHPPIDPGGSYTATWSNHDLMHFPSWQPVLRQSDFVVDAAKTHIVRLQLNMRYLLGNSDWAQINVFVVTPRPYAVAMNPVTTDPIEGQGYIQNVDDFNIRLNSAMYKVHYARYVTMTKDGLFDTDMSAVRFAAGNPYSTWKKGQINIRTKATIRSPFSFADTPKWKNMVGTDLPYYHRYMLLCYTVQRAKPETPINTGVKISFDQLAVTINTD